ncbi:CmcJ/NvfI family oxidoreductase [Streptomyces sp. NPDC002143]
MITTEINYAMAVDGRARFDPLHPEKMNVRFAPAPVTLEDARSVNDGLDLDVHGFKLVRHTSSIATTGTLTQLEDVYLDEMASFVKELVGAREVRPQRSGMLVRNSERVQKEKENGILPPARFAHMDYTERSKESFLQLSVEDDGPIAPYDRLAIYQTWRVISPPPQDTLLAVADTRTIADSDVFVMDSVLGPEEFPSCFFESRLSLPNEAHKWYYFPDMRTDEVLVFKGYDSDPDRCEDVMHTAFDNPEAPADAPPRESIEARFLAFFD